VRVPACTIQARESWSKRTATALRAKQPSISLCLAISWIYHRSHLEVGEVGLLASPLAAYLVFLETNELLPIAKLPVDDWEKLMLNVASSEINRDETTHLLRKRLKKRTRSHRLPKANHQCMKEKSIYGG
jgi:hypothetical protein